MSKGRLEAFSDGVIAIIITIMVLEMKVPEGHDLATLQPLIPVFCSYVLSFVFVGIYWNNHHHMLHAARQIDGRVMWSNLHLLFWLSLIPFVTGWMGENDFPPPAVALYGVVMLMAGLAYYLLTRALLRCQHGDSVLAAAVGNDRKGFLSVMVYVVAVPLSFVNRWVALALYVAVAAIWIAPDRRIERVMAAPTGDKGGAIHPS
jgi:TMEM175 potassium channel family protein